MTKYILGMDIGGTKCAVNLALVQSHIEMLDRVCFNTNADQGFESVRNRLFEQARLLLDRNEVRSRASAAGKPLFAIGVSCGGPLDCRRGLILSPPHLPGWDRIPFAEMLTREFSAPAFVQNDANACALVEWKFGAGRGTRNMVFLTMGTGFGAGIIAEGRLIEGARGFAGEIGHVRLDKDGPQMFGKTGTAEAFCGGAGIAEIARAHTRQRNADGKPPIWVREGLEGAGLNAKILAAYAEKGDPDALFVYRQAGEKLGQIVAILVDILNPERVVIGGVFTRAENLLRETMENTLRREALAGSCRDCRVVPARTGERIGDYASILAACHALGIDAAEVTDSANPAACCSVDTSENAASGSASTAAYDPIGASVAQKSEFVHPACPTMRVDTSEAPDSASPAALAHYARLFQRYPILIPLKENLLNAFVTLRDAFADGKKLLACGNGGSAADAEHIIGELMKGFLLPRPHGRNDLHPGLQMALPAIALTQHTALSTAFTNDVDPILVFAQQVFGYGRTGDVLLCLSTSGNTINCVEAAKTARALGLRVIALTGKAGGRLSAHCDVLLNVDVDYTPDVQELHLPIYHALCAMLEAEFFEKRLL